MKTVWCALLTGRGTFTRPLGPKDSSAYVCPTTYSTYNTLGLFQSQVSPDVVVLQSVQHTVEPPNLWARAYDWLNCSVFFSLRWTVIRPMGDSPRGLRYHERRERQVRCVNG